MPQDDHSQLSVDMNVELQDKLRRSLEFHGRGELHQAALLYRQILQAHPDHADALHLLGVIETQLGRAESGLEWISRSLAINPGQPVAVANAGNALMALARYAQAQECYERALQLWPDYHLALFGRGNALAALARFDDALCSFDRALVISPGFTPALCARGSVLLKLQRSAEALDIYDQALGLAPGLAQAHLGRGSALLALGDHAGAARSIDRAMVLAPASAEAIPARADLLSAVGEIDAAIAAYDRALQVNPSDPGVWVRRGLALSLRGRYGDAAASFRRALAIDPAYPYARGPALHAQLQLCDWHDYSRATQDIAASVERGAPVDFPFSFLAVCDSPILQRRCADIFGQLHRTRGSPLWAGERYRHARIRVAYVSADFLEHPTSFLMAGLFERHDRARFETIGISLRDDPASPMRRRVSAGFERFIVPGRQADLDIARLIRDLEVDIAVDLMGYTGEHRAAIFAHRPAPLQVGYLGFPATTGAGLLDYILADEFLIPAASRAEYGEQVVHLPGCFQVNDDRRSPSSSAPSRAQAGLPDHGFVWCSFHGSYKLNPPLFDVWMRLLLAEPHSVLWVLGGKPEVESNLRREAISRGVAPRRLVFATSLPYADHLARLPLADLCLDTLPFNGGATTSDALRAGVPVLTCAGRSFAARMSGSLLQALGLPELVAGSLQEYERIALRLAREPARLGHLRAVIAAGRTAGAVFDTDRFRRHLEAAFTAMIQRHELGLPPQHLAIPELPA